MMGIHGNGANLAYYIVLNGGYLDDKDRGKEFLHTGGGLDLKGNQIAD